MVDPRTGSLVFDQPKWTIERSLTLSGFLASDMGPHALVDADQPYSHCTLRNLQSGGQVFNVELIFLEERLHSVQVVAEEPPFSWEDHSEAKELQRKAHHDRWLAASLGTKREFSWGRVVSVYDKRAGFSRIAVEYQGWLSRGLHSPVVLAIVLTVSLVLLGLTLVASILLARLPWFR